MKRPLVIIAGPTAVGKTALSVRLAKNVGGEIISADSMQVYRRMDIGTAKVTPEETEGVPHHLIDILEPWEPFNVYEFRARVLSAMEEIYARGRLPVICGGLFYISKHAPAIRRRFYAVFIRAIKILLAAAGDLLPALARV